MSKKRPLYTTLVESHVTKDHEIWTKRGEVTRHAIVWALPTAEQNAFSKFACQVFQKSPLGWTPISSPWRFGTRTLARDKVSRLGYSEKL